VAGEITGIEWAFIAGYFTLILGVGWQAGRGNKSGADMHLGGRQTPWLAALISVVATEISAATLLGAPQASYNGALFYLQLMLGSLVGRYVVAFFFVPAYYDARVVTVYEFLETRLGAISRQLTSALFLLGRMISDSARLYMAALTLSTIYEMNLRLAATLILCSTAVYVLHGGIRAVIWTDVLQGTVFAGGGLIILAGLLHGLLGEHSLASLLAELSAQGKLDVFKVVDLRHALTDDYSLQAAFFGGIVFTMATHGTDHDMIQRVLTCRNRSDCARSLLGSGWAAMAVGMLFMLVGSALWLGSQHGIFQAQAGTSPMLTYLDDYATPAMRGLMTAAILAAGMSSLGSSLAASTAALTNDLLPARWTDSLAKNRLAMAGIAAALWTLTMGTSTYMAHHPELDLLRLALGSMTLIYGALLAFFMTALFSRSRPGRVRCLLAAACGVCAGVGLFLSSPLAMEWRLLAGLLVTGAILNLGTGQAGSGLGGGEPAEQRHSEESL
jgi:SSS family transporter